MDYTNGASSTYQARREFDILQPALIKRVVRLSCEAGLEDCTADPPKDGSATVFKAEALRTRSKEFLIKKFSDLWELCASAVNTSSQKNREQQNRTERSRC
jgi:hypothetical protein